MLETIGKLLVVSALIILKLGNGEENQRCSFEESTGILKCSDLILSNSSNEILMLNVSSLMEANETHQVDQLIIENSTIPTLNLNFIGLNQLNKLSGISIHECNITNVVGDIPCHISSLRLSNNMIQNFTAHLLKYGKEEFSKTNVSDAERSVSPEQYVVTMSKTCPKNVSLELENNNLEELPIHVVTSSRLKLLHLSGNPLKCEFFWETAWDHLNCSYNFEQCRQLFVNQNSSNCQFKREMVSSGLFHYNVAQIFESKVTFETECAEMNKTCLCHPFNLIRGEGGKITVYLKVTCTGKNLTELPKISKYTWELNVTKNYISNLKRLNSTEYRNLRWLDVSDNCVDELIPITYTDFMKRFDLLYIDYNKIQKIPDAFLLKVKNSEGKGKVRIGSHLECDCHSATSTKMRVIEIQDNIGDLNDVLCGNVMNETTNEYLKLKNLKLTEFCPIPNPNLQEFDWWLLAIGLEILCIVGIALKVIYDWRNYQRTGILPWIAEKLPRLPCDGILE